MKKLAAILLICLSTLPGASAQQNLAEKLGHPKNAKLLIVHADDLGLSHAMNAASIAAFEKKSITSASIQVPCPWFGELAAYARLHPEMDWGIHLTLTAEWKNYKWDGVLSADKIPSLLDANGHFYATVEDFLKHAKVDEVEAELRAQIKRALAFGIRITHLDSHMGALYATPQLTGILLKLAKEFGIPAFQPANLPGINLDRSVVVVDEAHMKYANSPATQWNKDYDAILQKLKPGLNELIVHLAYNTEEMRAITIDHPDYGSAWRQNDFNYVTSPLFKALLRKNNIILVSWGDILKATTTVKPK